MRKIKVLFMIVFASLFCFGCSINYRISINDDLSVREVITVKQKKRYIYETESIKTSLNDFEYKSYAENDDIKNNTVVSSDSNNDIYIYTKNYTSIDNYLNSSNVLKQYNIGFDIKDSLGVLTLESNKTYLYNTSEDDGEQHADLSFTLDTKFSVEESNKNPKDYTWDLSNETIYAKIYYNSLLSEKTIPIIVSIIVIMIIVIVSIVAYLKFKKNNK